MKKLLFSVLMTCMCILSINAQHVITNNYGTPITGSDGQSFSSDNKKESESSFSAGLMYYGFDMFENYGIFYSLINPNGVGLDIAWRSSLKSEDYTPMSADLLINYNFELWTQNSNMLLLTLALGPSFCSRKQGNDDSSFNIDGVINPRLTFKFGKFSLTGGYYYWTAKLKFSKNYKADGFNIGLGYEF